MFKEIETFISNKKKGERVCVCVLWQPNKLLWAKRQQVFMFKEIETFISNKKKGERVCVCVLWQPNKLLWASSCWRTCLAV